MVTPKRFAFLALAALLGCQTTPLLLAQSDRTEEPFEESRDLPQEDNLEWPAANFPGAAERGKPFHFGERFEYRAQWGLFHKAGTIVISTEAMDAAPEESATKMLVKTDTSSAGMIRAIYPLTLTATTTLDTQHWRMERNEVDGKTRSEKNKTLSLFDFEQGLMTFEDEDKPARNAIRRLPYDVPLDYSSALLQIRGWPLEVGGIYPLFVTSKGKFYYIELTVTEKETIKSPTGKQDCFRIQAHKAFPQSKLFREGGGFSIWITDDEQRLPIRLDVKTSIGNATLRLIDYQLAAPEGLAERRIEPTA